MIKSIVHKRSWTIKDQHYLVLNSNIWLVWVALIAWFCVAYQWADVIDVLAHLHIIALPPETFCLNEPAFPLVVWGEATILLTICGCQGGNFLKWCLLCSGLFVIRIVISKRSLSFSFCSQFWIRMVRSQRGVVFDLPGFFCKSSEPLYLHFVVNHKWDMMLDWIGIQFRSYVNLV